ncbi:PIG-L deacetylase family protein [Neobacillus muris]|uniref:PIG-L deacetylase family protein n=1 Tax=Neobacillus muris TaxID=2941334 RepID=UPI00203C3A36|nr:PIG-L family deacetylase [Neobacillus muris]
MHLVKKKITELFQLFVGVQKTIKFKEYMKGLYRYPTAMIGRKVSIHPTDVLVFAAHPDDEVLGLSAMMSRHLAHGEKVTVVYVTDGSKRGEDSWRRKKHLSQKIAETRYKEGTQGLSILNIPEKNVLSLGFPDGGTHRYLKEMANDIHFVINQAVPQKIYVHCIEGGHNDHDLVSLVVKSVCNYLQFQNVIEWAEYSPLYPIGTEKMKFLSPLEHHHSKEYVIELTDEERKQKKRMLACHQSQNVEGAYTQGEIIRRAKSKTS